VPIVILIVGVTGVLGRHVTRQLLAAGHAVRGLTRHPENAGDLEHLGASIVRGDLIDRASLEEACRGVDAVLACAHQLRGEGDYRSEAVDDLGHRTLIDVAAAAGVQHFVYTSAQHVSAEHPTDFYRSKAKVEAHLKQSGLHYTILRPSAFMEWHVHNLLGADILKTGKTTIFGGGDNPINFVAAQDVATIAVAALTTAGAADRSIEIGGPDNVTKNQVAAMYYDASGFAPDVAHVPVAAMQAMMQQPDQPVLGRLLTFGIWTDTADQTFDATEMLEVFPLTLIRVEDFVRDQVAGTTRSL
jgi:uncharacterized protein YbjT (DUF2867 family)